MHHKWCGGVNSNGVATSLERMDVDCDVRKSLVCCGATIAILYGMVGIILGLHGVAMPCNRYADANVTGCGPAQAFGDFRFNITYVDDVGGRHDGEIVSTTIGCSAGVLEQTVRVCYPIKDRDAFRNDASVMFANPVVTPALLCSAIPAFVGGIIVLCAVLTNSSRCRRYEESDGDFLRPRRIGGYGDGYGHGMNDNIREFIIPMGFVNSSSGGSAFASNDPTRLPRKPLE